MCVVYEKVAVMGAGVDENLVLIEGLISFLLLLAPIIVFEPVVSEMVNGVNPRTVGPIFHIRELCWVAG